MRGLAGVAPLAWQRLRASWRLLAVLAFGILAAATLMAVSPVYTRVMNDLGLAYSLKQEIGSASRDTVSEFGLPLGADSTAVERENLTRLIAAKLSWLTQGEVRYLAIPNLTLTEPGQVPSTDPMRTQITVTAANDVEGHAKLVEGRFAKETSDPSNMEAVIPVEVAHALKISPGARIEAARTVDDCNRPPPAGGQAEAQEQARFRCVPQATTVLAANLTIVGFIDKSDSNDPYWSAVTVGFQRPQSTDTEGPIISVLLPEGTFVHALPLVLPGLSSQFSDTAILDVTRLKSTTIGRAQDDLAALRATVLAVNGTPDLPTESALKDFHGRASFNQIPLLLLLLQVVGIALYYVVLVATMLADRRAEEIAMLRSRGATVLQIVSTSAIEAGILAAGAVLLAPFLAAAVVSLLGKTGTFHSISDGRLLAYAVPPEAFAFSIAGGLIAVIAVLIPAFFAARRGIVQHLQGTARPGKSFIQRYYIDFVLVGLAALALWELNQRGSVFDPHSAGGWSADPILLAAPLLLMVAIGALMFRFLPIVLGFVSRMMSLTAGPGVSLGLLQLTRSPSRYTQLALLVVMAAAVGTFAATYGDTTDRSQEDQARFNAGVDLRVNDLGRLQNQSPADVTSALAPITGVRTVATAFRGTMGMGPLAGLSGSVPVLAIDPQKAPDLLWFRKDFASQPEQQVLRRILGSPTGGQGLLVPGEAASLSVWASPTSARPGVTAWFQTRDAAGVFHLMELGELDFTGYRQLSTPVPAGSHFPLSIVGLLMTQGSGLGDPSRGGVFFDDITMTEPDGQEVVIDDFEGPLRWDSLRTSTQIRDSVAEVSQGQRRGNGAALYSFKVGTSVAMRGMFVSDPNLPAPAIASEQFLKRMNAHVGSEIELLQGSLLMPVKITTTVKLFPTMDDSGAGFLILNQDHVAFFAGLVSQETGLRPNEAWIGLIDSAAQHHGAVKELGDKFSIFSSAVTDIESVLANTRSDPVVRAGGSGILLVSLVAAFLMLGLGFGLTLFVSGQARTVEISVVRAMGFSRAQLITMVTLEYVIVAAAGLSIGALAGLRISRVMLGFLNVTADGARLIPPFVLTTHWATVTVAFAIVAVAFGLGILALAAYFLRLPVSRILRITR